MIWLVIWNVVLTWYLMDVRRWARVSTHILNRELRRRRS